MNNAIKQWALLGLAMGATVKDFQETLPVTPAKPLPVPPKPAKPVIDKHPFTAAEALKLHKEHRNWATVAKLMGKRKSDVIALVHDTDPVSQSKARQPATTPSDGLTIKEATRIALNSKNYRTMRELVAVVREQNICRPAYKDTVDVHVHQMIKAGQVKVHKQIGKLTGYKLVGGVVDPHFGA